VIARHRARPSPRVVGGAVALAVAVAGLLGLWYLFFRPAGPGTVNVSQAALPSTDGSGVGTGSDPAGFDGTWKVNTTLGSFADFSDSFVGYRVQEELAGIGAQQAVGRTPAVSGTATLAGTVITTLEVSADLTALKSDDDRRDNQLRRQSIETDAFPTATFTLTRPIELGSLATDGSTVTASATGRLTLHGVTRDVTLQLQGRYASGVVVVAGSTEIVFADYGIERPNSFIVLSVADRGTLEIQLLFTKAG
jgi:polyisoprenoid-binding protein YceI